VTGQASGLDRGPFELSVFVTMAIIIGVGVWFYVIGRGHAVHDRWPDEGTTADRREATAVRRA